MKTESVISAIGSAKQVAEILGISQSAVSQWGEDVPELRSYQLMTLRPDVRWDVLRANPAEALVNTAQTATETVAQGV